MKKLIPFLLVLVLIWLYLTAVVLIMGAEVNDLLLERRRRMLRFRRE